MPVRHLLKCIALFLPVMGQTVKLAGIGTLIPYLTEQNVILEVGSADCRLLSAPLLPSGKRAFGGWGIYQDVQGAFVRAYHAPAALDERFHQFVDFSFDRITRSIQQGQFLTSLTQREALAGVDVFSPTRADWAKLPCLKQGACLYYAKPDLIGESDKWQLGYFFRVFCLTRRRVLDPHGNAKISYYNRVSILIGDDTDSGAIADSGLVVFQGPRNKEHVICYAEK